ncbi:MAG: radical SAM protein [Nanoarchaeota archaeon]|nr:radical SAM protein [Nanoarchaeota archaeon]MBU1031052.1 radical SAM protein [Nanoarchaeota archaeon]MBU1850094.1 radical SAM protein [Nanoarchaeota archaeon]
MKRKLVEVAFEVTYKCNLRCSHCYNIKNLAKDKDELNTAEVFLALQKLKKAGVEKIKFGGGEPLLRLDFFQIYNHARELGFDVNFSSNGLLILPNMKRIIDNYIDKLQISLDNVDQKHDLFRGKKGLFSIVEESIKELTKHHVKINIATTLTNDNKDDLEGIYSFCKENNVARWKIMKYIPKDLFDNLLISKKDYETTINKLLEMKNNYAESPEIIVAREFNLIKTPKDYNDMQCFGGKSFFSLKPNGMVTPCSYIDNIDCGNIKTLSVGEIWNNPKIVEFSEDCYDKNCLFGDKCFGGCKALNYKLTNNPGCDPYCWVKKS